MDEIIKILQNLQKDMRGLRTDMHKLSDKVDHLSDKSRDVISYESSVLERAHKSNAKQTTTNIQQNNQNVNYGRPLSPSEQKYINKLHDSEPVDQNVKSLQHKETVSNNLADIAPVAPVTNLQSSIVHKESLIKRSFSWIAKDWPMKIGGFFVIAAVGWFVTYATMEGWLSEMTRVVLGYIFSLACVVFGAFRAEKNRVQGNLFLIIGIAAILVSTLAGIHFDIVTHIAGLFVMLVSVGFVTLVSLKQKNISLTSSMIFFGAVIPLFFFADVGINTIFVYLFILTLGTLWVVSFTGWRKLTTLMLVVVGFYSISYIVGARSAEIEVMSNILVAFLFTAMFYVANVSAIIRSENPRNYDLITALGIGTLFLIWILSFTSKEFEVSLLLVGVLFFAGASYVIFIQTKRKAPTIIYSCVTATLFAVATALQFDGPVLVTAYLVEASAGIIITLYFAQRGTINNIRTFLTFLYAIPVLMSLVSVASLFDFISYPYGSVMDEMPELFAVFIVCITAFSVAISVLRLTNTKEKENMTFFRIFAYTGGIYGLLLIWFVTHLFMDGYDIATFVSLVIYTITGVGFYILGVRESYKPYKFIGGMLFGIVVVRVIFVEFWEMDIVMRIITSFVLGALLISTAFIRSDKKQ